MRTFEVVNDKIIFEERIQNLLLKLEQKNKELKDIKYALNASSMLTITNADGCITYINEAFSKITQYEEFELIGNNHRIVNSGHHPREFFEDLWKTIKNGNIWRGEVKNKTKNGSIFWADTTIVPFLNNYGTPYQYVAIRKDITNSKNAEEMLIKSEKQSAIGKLASGIAHEIRNPLTTIKGFAQFLKADIQDEKKLKYFDTLLSEIDRINFIVEELMILAKPNVYQFNTENINSIINEINFFLESEANLKNVQISLKYERDDIYVFCEKNQLKQVFLNLLKNAIEAMPKGGNIEINVAIKGNTVQVSIQDEGMGIPKEDLEKMGEIFFSTKEKGNGLGLFVSFKIIQNHKGYVNIKSEVNKGTNFRINLPIAKI